MRGEEREALVKIDYLWLFKGHQGWYCCLVCDRLEEDTWMMSWWVEGWWWGAGLVFLCPGDGDGYGFVLHDEMPSSKHTHTNTHKHTYKHTHTHRHKHKHTHTHLKMGRQEGKSCRLSCRSQQGQEKERQGWRKGVWIRQER